MWCFLKQALMQKFMNENECIFWLKMTTYWKNIILFVIKLMLISKRNLIASLPIIRIFWKPKNKSHGDEVTDF